MKRLSGIVVLVLLVVAVEVLVLYFTLAPVVTRDGGDPGEKIESLVVGAIAAGFCTSAIFILVMMAVSGKPASWWLLKREVEHRVLARVDKDWRTYLAITHRGALLWFEFDRVLPPDVCAESKLIISRSDEKQRQLESRPPARGVVVLSANELRYAA